MEVKLSSILMKSNTPDSTGCIISESAISKFMKDWKSYLEDSNKPKSLYEINPEFCYKVCKTLKDQGIIADPRSFKIVGEDLSENIGEISHTIRFEHYEHE